MQQIPAEETSYQKGIIQVAISVAREPSNEFQLIDSQRPGAIIYEQSLAGWPAAPVGLFPRKVPVICRSG
jgi:hypothetical protein